MTPEAIASTGKRKLLRVVPSPVTDISELSRTTLSHRGSNYAPVENTHRGCLLRFDPFVGQQFAAKLYLIGVLLRGTQVGDVQVPGQHGCLGDQERLDHLDSQARFFQRFTANS